MVDVGFAFSKGGGDFLKPADSQPFWLVLVFLIHTGSGYQSLVILRLLSLRKLRLGYV